MLTALLLFLFYTALLLFILYRLSLKKSFALSYKEAAIFFIIKVAAGCFYGYFFLHYYGGDDTWLYHNEALKEYALLKTDTLHFFINDIVPKGYKSNPLVTVFNSNDSYAKDLELSLLLKLIAVFDLFSGGRYYVNDVFYNAFVFWGSYCLFKVLNIKYPDKQELWLLFIFCFPPLIFWTSGIRKDGLCFAIVCGLIYQLYKSVEIRSSIRNIFGVIILFVLLFLFRNYTALTFIPVIIAYSLSIKKNKPGVITFAVTLLCCAIAFFLTIFLPDAFNLPLKMAERQHAFLQLSGKSYLQTDLLTSNISSYIKVFFEALNHIFIRPYLTEAKGPLYVFSFCEMVFFFFLILRIFIKPSPEPGKKINDPFMLLLITTAFLNYIIIGYTVPFLGAIVRYKAPFEILFLLAFLYLQNTSFFFKKNKSL